MLPPTMAIQEKQDFLIYLKTHAAGKLVASFMIRFIKKILYINNNHLRWGICYVFYDVYEQIGILLYIGEKNTSGGKDVCHKKQDNLIYLFQMPVRDSMRPLL